METMRSFISFITKYNKNHVIARGGSPVDFRVKGRRGNLIKSIHLSLTLSSKERGFSEI